MYIRYFVLLIVLFSTVSSFGESHVIGEFKSYIASLKSVAIEFTQEDSRESKANGRLIIVKPYNFLCNYYPPYPLVIAGNKTYLSIYDFDMDQITLIDSKDNMFNFLLTDNVDLEKHFTITHAIKKDNEISVELHHIESDRTTKVIISLEGTNKTLKSIETHEADGNIITLSVHDISNIYDVNKSLFIMKNPNIYGTPTRMNHTDLEKRYKIID